MAESETLVRLQGATLGYGRRVVLRDVNLFVPRGGFFGIIGPNGSGKTTLLRALLGLRKPASGTMDYPAGRPRLGYVQQRQFIDELFPLTVAEIVLMGRAGRAGPFRRFRPEDREAAREAMETLDVHRLQELPFRHLSGGQKQRCLIARALASEPELLVLDEPTNDMDIAGEERILRLISRIHEERGITVLMVSHLLNVVLNFAGHLALLRDGRLSEGTVEEMVTAERMSAFFGIPVYVERVGGRRVVVPAGGAYGEEMETDA